MDRSKLLTAGGVVVGFFLVGQAARHAVDGLFVVAAIEAFLAVALLATLYLARE